MEVLTLNSSRNLEKTPLVFIFEKGWQIECPNTAQTHLVQCCFDENSINNAAVSKYRSECPK